MPKINKKSKDENSNYDTELSDYLISHGAGSLCVPMIFCDSNHKICFATDFIEKNMIGVRPGASIDNFITAERLENDTAFGKIYSGGFHAKNKDYNVLVFKKRHITDFYVLIVLIESPLFDEAYLMTNVKSCYHDLIRQIDLAIDKFLTDGHVHACELLKENIRNLSHITDIIDLFHDLRKKPSSARRLINLACFLSQFCYDANACLKNGRIQQIESAIPSYLKVEANYEMMFSYFSLISLNLLLISIDDSVRIKVMKTTNHAVEIVCSSDVPFNIFPENVGNTLRASDYITLNGLVISLFKSNSPFALDLVILNEFLSTHGWHLFCTYEGESVEIHTIIPNIVDREREIFAVNEPGPNRFEQCVHIFNKWTDGTDDKQISNHKKPVYKNKLLD